MPAFSMKILLWPLTMISLTSGSRMKGIRGERKNSREASNAAWVPAPARITGGASGSAGTPFAARTDPVLLLADGGGCGIRLMVIPIL